MGNNEEIIITTIDINSIIEINGTCAYKLRIV